MSLNYNFGVSYALFQVFFFFTYTNFCDEAFFVYANENSVYEGNCYFPEVSVGYNTEEDCKGASLFAEERWNFAFWRQNNEYIINSTEETDGAAFLLNWYRSRSINNIGFEDVDAQYDENMQYIGKGPVGYYEVLCAVSNVAKRIQEEGLISDKFGHIPVIVHDLEYPWYVEEATRNANPGGEADAFLAYLRKERSDMEFADIGFDTDEKIEAFLTSAHNEQCNSSDDAVNIIDKILPFIGDENEIGDMHHVLGDFFTHLLEMQKDVSDDTDTE